MTRFRQSLRKLYELVGQESLLLCAFSLSAGLLLAFGMIAEEVQEGDVNAFDSRILAFFGHTAGSSGAIQSPRLLEFGRDVTALGSYAVLGFLTIAAVGYLLLIRQYLHAGLTTLSVVGGLAISTILKTCFDRPRPDIPHAVSVFSASFPSGHAMLSTVTYLTLVSLLARVTPDRPTRFYLLALAIFLSVAVGISRVYLGVHYPSDVMAGWCLGGAWAALCFIGVSLLERKQGPLQ